MPGALGSAPAVVLPVRRTSDRAASAAPIQEIDTGAGCGGWSRCQMRRARWRLSSAMLRGWSCLRRVCVGCRPSRAARFGRRVGQRDPLGGQTNGSAWRNRYRSDYHAARESWGAAAGATSAHSARARQPLPRARRPVGCRPRKAMSAPQ
jgi:hypothetical protein